MKQIETIIMPEGIKHLSLFMEELPTGIFNKKITATGATSLAMENKQDLILLVPNIGLIENKIAQYPNERCDYEFLQVDEHVKTGDIIEYINKCKGIQPVKIIGTYDSLIKMLGITNVYKKYALIIDEFHELLSLKSARELRGILILNEFKKFKKYTFLSATPLIEDFLPDVLNDIPYTELIIQNSEKIKVVSQQTDKPFSMIIDFIKTFKINNEVIINGHISKHLYIYINSVTSIASIIKSSGLTQQDVNIYCGDYRYNDIKLEKVGCELGALLTKEQLKNNPEYEKQINFITSKGFKGVDIYSNDGVAIYVTNTFLKSTYSGMEVIQQISGRQRLQNNPFNGLIYHIYNVNYASLTFDEYLKKQQVAIDDAKEIIAGWDNVPQAYKNKVLDALKNFDLFDKTIYYYYDRETDKVYLNDLRIKSDQSQHKVENLIYTEGIEVRKAYIEQGFEDLSAYYRKAESDFKNYIQHKTFKEYCIAYNDSITMFNMDEPLYGCAEITKKLIINAFKELGYERIKELKYHQGSIKTHLREAINYDGYSILRAIDKLFIVGERYKNPYLKAQIQIIYNDLGIDKKAKGTSIYEYFKVKPCKMPDKTNGLLLENKLYSIVNK